MTPLSGLVVLDLSSGPAGGLATMILSDFGATVVRFDDPRYGELNHAPAARMWLRGKAIARTPLHEAVKTADVLVTSSPHGFSGADYDALHRINPGLVYAEVSAFGDDSRVPATESVVAAKMGRMKSMQGLLPAPGPRYAAVQVATHATSQNLVTGILAALIDRARTGTGQRVATSLAHGLIPYDQGASLAMQVRAASGEDEPIVDPATIMPTLNYHPVQCADGKWIQLGNLLPHLFANFMRAIGLEAELERILENPRDKQIREDVRDRILLTMQTGSSTEWMAKFLADGSIAAHVYQTAEQALDDPDMTANGHVMTLDSAKQLGPLARLDGTPAEPGTLKEGPRWSHPAPEPHADTASTLGGVTVVELATIIAAPLASSFLADLGARVIKIETIGGDPYRGMGGGFGATRCNQGKESIGVDLKSDEGRKIVHKLVEGADIVIHNFRPGVPERLGIDYAALTTIKPDIIYISANGYGPEGPGARRPSTHPIPGAAMGGALYQAGGAPASTLDITGLREASRRLMRANEVNPDPNTAVAICTSALLGLVARKRTGRGQQIYGDMFIANAYANFDDFIAYPQKPQRPPLDAELLGTGPLNRLYQCEDAWVFLGIVRLEDWERFCEILGETHLTSHYPDPINDHHPELAGELESLFASNTGQHFESLLFPKGIGCVVADQQNLAEKFLSEARPGSRWMIKVDHPDYGDYYRHTPMITFSRSRTRAAAGTRGGAHTRTIMARLGYADHEIDGLYTRGVLWSA